MSLKCLILKVNNDIYTIEIKGNNYEVIKDRGEIKTAYTTTENYWMWWKEKTGYIDEGLDILTISDTEFLIDNSVNNIRKLTWELRDILEVLNILDEKSDHRFKILDYNAQDNLMEVVLDGENVNLVLNKKLGDDVKIKKAEELKTKSEIKKDPPRGSIADYYKRETRKYMK
ncbi:MAG: hypothetical protein ACRCTS_07040 [Fusobacteriaceae bacterium]